MSSVIVWHECIVEVTAVSVYEKSLLHISNPDKIQDGGTDNPLGEPRFFLPLRLNIDDEKFGG